MLSAFAACNCESYAVMPFAAMMARRLEKNVPYVNHRIEIALRLDNASSPNDWPCETARRTQC
jgi:hypothetical protein